MKIKILILTCLLITTLSKAQQTWTKGQLVLKNGKTLTGLIKLPNISGSLVSLNGAQKVRFQKDKKSKKTKYGPDQVEKLIFKNSDTEIAYYEYVKTSKNRKELFKVIISGKATLYARKVNVSAPPVMMNTAGPNGVTFQHWNYSFSSFNEFFVIKEGEKKATPMIKSGIPSSFKKRASKYFSDCPSVVEKLKNRTYKRRDIKDVVYEYNSCE